MPQFNASSALLLKRFIESGVTSPEELANVIGNASVATARIQSRWPTSCTATAVT